MRPIAKPATSTPKEFGGTGNPSLDEHLNRRLNTFGGATHPTFGTFLPGSKYAHLTPGQAREREIANFHRGDRGTAEQGAMPSMAENFAALKRPQVQSPAAPTSAAPAAPAAPAVPPSPALPAASAVANNTAAAPIQSPAATTSTAQRPPGIRDDGEAAIQNFLRNEVANMNPDGRRGAKVGWADDGRNGQKLVSVPSGERSGMAHLDALGEFQRKQQMDRADAYAGTLQRGQTASPEGFAAWSKANPVNYDMQSRAAQAYADAAVAPRAVTSRAGGAMPTGATTSIDKYGMKRLSSPHGDGMAWKSRQTDAALSAQGAGIYENGKRVMSPATTGPSASVTMPNGKVESTAFARPEPPRTGNAFDDGADMQAEAKPAPEPARVIKARAELETARYAGSGTPADFKRFKTKQKNFDRAMNPALVNAQDELEKARYAGSGTPADFKRFKTAQAKVAAMNPAEPAQDEPAPARLTAR